MMKNRLNTAKVEWDLGCFSWNFIDKKEVSVKMEEISPGGHSDPHHHKRSLQFFFILEGEAVVNLGNKRFELKKNEGIEIPSGLKHQILNSGEKNLLFLLISSPGVHGDDILV